MKTPLLLALAFFPALSFTSAADDAPEPRAGSKGKGRPGFFQNLDKDGDQSISREEAGDRWEQMAKLDRDGDEKVSPQELMAARPRRARTEPTDPEPSSGKKPEGPRRPGPGEMFKNADKNQDGKISPDEVSGQMWTRLVPLDKDQDGAVTREELAAMAPGRGADRPGPRRPGAGGPRGGAGEIFGRYDGDQNGKLGRSEVPGEMWEKLSKADANADGLISREELEEVYRNRDGLPGRPLPRPTMSPEEKESEKSGPAKAKDGVPAA